MFDEDYDGDDQFPPPHSIVESELYEHESVIEERGGGQYSPPQSVIEEVFEEEEYDEREGGVRNMGNLSTVEEDDEEREETRRSELNSSNFVSGAQAINRINEDELVRRKKHEFIENDPRFNNTFNPKENSWEPSPYHSRIEERGDEENRPLRRDNRSILPSSLDTSKSNRSANKSVKFSEKTETRVVTPISSSGSTTTLIPSNERVTATESPTKNTQGDLPCVSSSSHPSTAPLKGVPASPSESIASTASSVYVSTPNDRLSKQQISRSLRARFSDISAIEGTGKSGNHSGGFLSLAPQDSKQPQRGPVPPPPSNDTLTNSDIINIVQHSDKSANLMSALDNARKQPKKMRKVDFSQSGRSTRSSVGGGEESRSTTSSRQPSLTPLSSSTCINTSSTRPLSTTFITNSSMKESTRRDEEKRGERQERQERLPDVTSLSSRREMSMRNESVVSSSRRETSMRNEEYGRKDRLPEIRPSIRVGERSGEYNRQSGASSLPPRPPLRPTQRSIDEPLRRNETNTSTLSGVSSRSCQSEERVGSRAESVTSSASNKSGRLISSEMRELDFGFVTVGDSRIHTFKAKSSLDFPVTCNYSLKSDAKSKKDRPFTILDGTESIIQPRADITVRVQFTPLKDCKHNDQLCIKLSGGGVSQRFGINMIGSGGRAHLELVKRQGLLLHRSGDHVLTTDSDGPITLGVENDGKRTMYVRAVVLDGYGKKMEGDIFSPSHSFVIAAGDKQPLKVDVSRARMNDSGRCSSSLSSLSGMGIRRSSTTSVNSIGSSASSRGRSAPSYTIKLYWGEETQRRRMIAYCRTQSHTSFPPLCPVEEDFSNLFVGEQDEETAIDPDRKLKKMDMDYFSASMRVANINVHLTAPISNVIDDDSDQDRTLIADDTFRGNETMISMIPDLTVLKIRR